MSALQDAHELTYAPCNLCPRHCGIDRTSGKLGFCKQVAVPKIARAALHFWEEPIISGERGSGTVFFSGCNLQCVYCQNYKISTGGFGKEVSVKRLAEIFLELQQQGAHNINLVTPSIFLPSIVEALDLCRDALKVPLVYNCGGYEDANTIRALASLVDIWLPDFKYANADTAHAYSAASDYPKVALQAIKTMIEVAGPPILGEDGMLKRGVCVRHLVLPGKRCESIAALDMLLGSLPQDSYYLSLMAQYTPPEQLLCHAGTAEASSENMTPRQEAMRDRNLRRRIMSAEYDPVVEHALELGVREDLLFTQERASASMDLRPSFELEGI